MLRDLAISVVQPTYILSVHSLMHTDKQEHEVNMVDLGCRRQLSSACTPGLMKAHSGRDEGNHIILSRKVVLHPTKHLYTFSSAALKIICRNYLFWILNVLRTLLIFEEGLMDPLLWPVQPTHLLIGIETRASVAATALVVPRYGMCWMGTIMAIGLVVQWC